MGGVPGLDFSRLGAVKEVANEDSGRNHPASTTNKDSGRRNSFRPLVSPMGSSSNALVARAKQGISSALGSELGGGESDRDM